VQLWATDGRLRHRFFVAANIYPIGMIWYGEFWIEKCTGYNPSVNFRVVILTFQHISRKDFNLSRALIASREAPRCRHIESSRHSEVKKSFEDLDQWLRRKLCCIIWRQWKRPATRAKKLVQRGLSEEQARRSAGNGRGP
jgi:hypothetical protein